MADILNSLPRRQSDYTKEQADACIEFWMKETLSQLRRRQDICSAQIGEAYRRRLTETLEDLRFTEDWLTEAVSRKVFGS